jgi:hypothetical protein
VRIGYGHNDVRNVTASNLTIESNRGIGIFTRNPGSVSNVHFRDLIIRTRLCRGHWWGKAEPIHLSALPMSKDEPAGRISDVHFRNVSIPRAEGGIVLYASEPGLIRDVCLENVTLNMSGSELQADYGGNIDLRPALDAALRIFRHDIPAVYARGVQKLRLENLQIEWRSDPPAFFSHAVECEDFADLSVDRLHGAAAPTAPDQATIALRRGQGAILRNTPLKSEADKLLLQESVRDLKVERE